MSLPHDFTFGPEITNSLERRDSLEIEVGPFQQHTPFRSFSLDLVHPLSPIKPTRRLKALLQRRLWTLEGTLVSMRQTVALTSQLRDTCLHTRKELFDLTDDPRLPRYFAKGQRTMLAHRVLISGVDPTFSTTSHSRHHSQSISRGRAEEDEEDCEVASPEKSIIHKVP